MRLVVAALTLLAASPANADWQYTRWGMTVGEVKAASPYVVLHEAPDLSLPSSRVKAGAKYRAGGMSFTAAFGFGDDGGLNRVKLYLDDGSRCDELRHSLRSVYGEEAPNTLNNSIVSLAKWRDEENKNMIGYLAIGDDKCSVTYEPIRSTNETGL